MLNSQFLFKKKYFLFFLAIALLISSCSNDHEDDLINSDTNPNDPVELVTYKNNVKVIIDNNCISCHALGGTQGTYPLETYNQVKNSALSGKLYSRMTDAANPMPPTGILPGTVTQIIENWINDGLLEE